jgi:hypothetical protein
MSSSDHSSSPLPTDPPQTGSYSTMLQHFSQFPLQEYAWNLADEILLGNMNVDTSSNNRCGQEPGPRFGTGTSIFLFLLLILLPSPQLLLFAPFKDLLLFPPLSLEHHSSSSSSSKTSHPLLLLLFPLPPLPPPPPPSISSFSSLSISSSSSLSPMFTV